MNCECNSLSAAFADVFDEDTWYQFCFVFVCCTIVCVFLLSRWEQFKHIDYCWLYTLIFIFVNSRYIDIRSQDPLDRDHKGVKLKKKTAPVKGASAEEQKCFFKDEWWCKLRKMYFYIVFNKFPFPLPLVKVNLGLKSTKSYVVILLNDNSRTCVWDTRREEI